MLRHPGDEIAEFVATDPGAGRVVRIGDENHAGPVVDQRQHRPEVVPVRLRLRRVERARNLPGRATGLRHHAVNHERVLRIDRLGAGVEKSTRDQVEDVVGSIPERDLFGRNAELRGQPVLEIIAIGIGIEPNLLARPANRVAHPRRAAERVFIRRELVGIADAELALELLDRLAGQVGRQRLDLRQGGIECGHQSDALG